MCSVHVQGSPDFKNFIKFVEPEEEHDPQGTENINMMRVITDSGPNGIYMLYMSYAENVFNNVV